MFCVVICRYRAELIIIGTKKGDKYHQNTLEDAAHVLFLLKPRRLMMSPLPGCTLQKDDAKLSSDIELNWETTTNDHHKQAEMENSQNSPQIVGLIVVKNLS